MLGAGGALTDIVCDVCIDAGQVDCLSHLCLHLLNPLVDSMQVSKNLVEKLWGNVDTASLE